jgi:hypothetical protein
LQACPKRLKKKIVPKLFEQSTYSVVNMLLHGTILNWEMNLICNYIFYLCKIKLVVDFNDILLLNDCLVGCFCHTVPC